MVDIKLTSPVFKNRENIPKKFTCQGQDINPELEIAGIPKGTKSLALIMDDPDAPGGTFVHWLLWNIDPKRKKIEENSLPKEATVGINSWDKNSYGGPCPPSGTHRYFFKLFAIDTQLELGANNKKTDLLNEIQKHKLAQTELVGLYKKS